MRVAARAAGAKRAMNGKGHGWLREAGDDAVRLCEVVEGCQGAMSQSIKRT